MDDNLMRKKILIIGAVVIVLLSGGYFLYCYYAHMRNQTQEILADTKETVPVKKVSKKEEKEETMKVDIKGEVKKPNIYSATQDDRVIDIITKAGGLTKNADTSIINLSKKVKDEMVIIIYSKKEIKEYKQTKEKQQQVLEICEQEDVKNDACIDQENESNLESSETHGLININTATIEQLQTLPKIGQSKAKSIISYREKNNGFKTIEEIKNVSGIGESVFDQIKNLITI